jgi:hypothetical protein
MNDNQTIFDELLNLLHEKDVLRRIILIGSWCLPIYKVYFNNASEVPILRTMDLDILVPLKLNLSNPIDVPSIFKSIGFDEEFSHLTGYCKYVHPEMEVEFMVPEPSAFILLKFLVSTKRKNSKKREKDLKTAAELGAYLITRSDQRSKLKSAFSSMHKNWQKTLLGVLREQSNPLLLDVLIKKKT